MAEIKAATNEKVFQITAFRGLNQNPDGDTKLKLGEASEMVNFRITRDGNLQRRPGTKTLVDFETEHPVKGLWNGYVNGHEYLLGACNSVLYKLWDEANGFQATALGTVSTENDVYIFGFENKAYILDKTKYRYWDGTDYEEVDGYVPLVQIAIPPVNGSGESASLENVNRLTAKRRVWISPDGTGTKFLLPENDLYAIDYVKDLGTGQNVSTDNYTTNVLEGSVTFTTVYPPPQAVNSYEIGYTAKNDFRLQVESMQYAELFSGVQDTRIFLYGDGTNKTIYSGMDYNGKPKADYFPDLYEALVGDENTPITGMIRHYSSLACFKSDSAWSITANSLTLSEGLNIPAFYVTPINKAIGLEANGQVRLVLNSPYTLYGNDLYEWKNSSYYTSNLTRDERQAKRISDRVWATLKNFGTKHCICYDDNAAQEYYICFGGNALVYNYAADAWSKYSAFPVSSMVNVGDELYIGTPDGKLKHFSADYLDDDNTAIQSYWESGSMSFGQEYMRKYSATCWVAVKPESKTEAIISVRTDKKLCESRMITTAAYQFDFGNVDFEHFKFDEYFGSQIYREKIKAKKFVFYKLLLKSESADARCTILSADIRVRFTGMAK